MSARVSRTIEQLREVAREAGFKIELPKTGVAWLSGPNEKGPGQLCVDEAHALRMAENLIHLGMTEANSRPAKVEPMSFVTPLSAFRP